MGKIERFSVFSAVSKISFPAMRGIAYAILLSLQFFIRIINNAVTGIDMTIDRLNALAVNFDYGPCNQRAVCAL